MHNMEGVKVPPTLYVMPPVSLSIMRGGDTNRDIQEADETGTHEVHR